MAGVKVTDLPVLGAAASDDVLYIVDTSDNLSKQIEVSSLLPVLESGTWTPTFDNFGSAITDASPVYASYSRVGSIVTCSINGTFDSDFSSFNDGSFDSSLPIATSTSNSNGVVSIKEPNQFNGVALDNATKATFKFLSLDTSFVGTSFTFSAVFQYEIN